MGVAIDTVLVDLHNATTNAATLTNGTITNSGDSLGVRSFDPPAWARLEGVTLMGSSVEQVRILSPRLHDNVTGLTWESAESPTQFLLPKDVGEPLYSSDTLTVQMSAAASYSPTLPRAKHSVTSIWTRRARSSPASPSPCFSSLSSSNNLDDWLRSFWTSRMHTERRPSPLMPGSARLSSTIRSAKKCDLPEPRPPQTPL